MWARVEDNVVLEVIDVNPGGRYHPSIEWIPCSDEVLPTWTLSNGTFSPPQVDRTRVLEDSLALIDRQVEEADSKPFPYLGHNFYPDTEFIQGVYSVLPLLPSGYTETWKTADKMADGVSSVYITLDKAGIQGLALAYLQFKKGNWMAGEQRKQTLKNEFLSGV